MRRRPLFIPEQNRADTTYKRTVTIGLSFNSTLAAARTGADWAWAALYRDLAPVVFGFVRARGASEPEDVLAETFLDVVRNLGGFEGGERQFRTWVLTIAHRRLIDERRARSVRPVDPVAPEALSERHDPAMIEDEAIARSEVDRTLRLIRDLSPERQTVLLLRLIADLTVDEIATVVGKRPGAVKVQLRRALATLHKRLAGEGVPL